MPKKLCCCKDVDVPPILVPHWVAVPCVEYISEIYDDVGYQLAWPSSGLIEPYYSGITYPFKYVDAPDFITLDNQREVYGMIRGGGGGGKTGDSISEPVKGGNAGYGEKIIPAFSNFGFYVGPGGSGPEALNIHNASTYSGAKGYPKAAWGGALSAMGFGTPLTDFASGGGGGGTKNFTEGGHGGLTQGNSGGSNLFEDAYGAWGGGLLYGGTSGLIGAGNPATNPETGFALRGGRGQILTNTSPIVPFDYAGGGGGAGWFGGGGGASGGGGGGGSNKVNDATDYNFSGTDTGPGSRCNPYFGLVSDYGLGAHRVGRSIEDCPVSEGCPDTVTTFKTGTTGMQGVASTYFRNKWCSCTETQTEGKRVPVPNYICLNEDQYLKIISLKPTPTSPPGSNDKLSFVLNGTRYVLLYKCNLGCESDYVVAGEPTDVKWYVKNLNAAWFADYPSWSSNDVTSCCDCYDCEPICKSPGAPLDQPTPPRVRSCDILAGVTCYWHLDETDTLWYYQCKKSNCWADFGLPSIVTPYETKVMLPNTDFECGEDPCDDDKTWIAEKCDLITQKECCEESQCCGPAQIKFCDAYLRKLLIPYPGTYPIDTNLYCYYFRYVGCIYIISYSVTDPPCISSDSTPENPINEGDLFAITNKSGLDCCRVGLFAGGTDPGAVKPPPEPLPCEDVVVECFPFKDQYGTVEDVLISSPLNGCGYEPGVEWFIRCGDPLAKPNTYYPVSPDYVQRTGLCYDARPRAETLQGMNLADRKSYHRYTINIPYECPDCPSNLVCDCNCYTGGGGGGGGGGGAGPGSNPGNCLRPCVTTPQHCSGELIATDSYTIETQYKIGVAGAHEITYGPDIWYREDAFKLKFSLCEAQNAGIDLNDEEALFNFYKQKVRITSNIIKQQRFPWEEMRNCTVGVAFYEQPQSAMCVSICDYEVKVYSGNAGHICEKINGRLNGIVQATGINPYFWFGHRVGCTQCTESPNEAQPRTLGDDLEIDRGFKDTGAFSYTIFVAGVSQRWYVCACQSITPTTLPSQGQVRNISVSENSLSQAEYAKNLRYSMRNVISNSSTSRICTPSGALNVTECEQDGDWPYDDVTVGGLVVVEGFSTLGGGLDCSTPRRTCNIYDLEYNVATCNGPDNVLCMCNPFTGAPMNDTGVICNVYDQLQCTTQGGTIQVN